MMEVVYARCCGIDIHKKMVVACLIVPDPAGRAAKDIRTFSTMTDELLGLGDWLAEAGCTQVAMESTGVYWKPIWNLLEGSFELLLANAQHIKAVPGRKTDVRDCEWIADLPRHGWLRASFVPDREQREVRELTRYRLALVRERSREVQRLLKRLEGALVGRFAAHQRFLVARQLGHLDDLDGLIAELRAQIAERLRPFQAQIDRLDTIPGVGRATAEVIVAEIGTAMTRFPTDCHLASWAAVCPGNHESAGKRQSGKTRKGNRALRTALVEAAKAAGRARHTYLGAHYQRLLRRRGKHKATLAVAHSILIISYHLLKDGTTFTDLGGDFFDRRNQDALERRLVSRLEPLGNKVSIEKVA